MRSRYGARSEKLDPDGLQLALEEVAPSLGAAYAVVDPGAPPERKATG
jgi:Transposase C of IS166 homeodomain